MPAERLMLRGAERTRYYAPTLICAYLVALCAVLTITAAFLPRRQDAVAMVAAGLFGVLASGGLGLLFFVTQRRALRYRCYPTRSSAAVNYARLKAAALSFGWRLSAEESGRWLQAWTQSSKFAEGELVAVECRDREVRIVSIPDLDIGFSRAALKRCREHCERLAAVLAAPGP